jgi:hypothetical protein
MGVLLWVACGVAAFAVARSVPVRRRSPVAEVAIAAAAAALAGVVATTLDFGGVRELDPRAALFAFLIAAAAIGGLRILIGDR